MMAPLARKILNFLRFTSQKIPMPVMTIESKLKKELNLTEDRELIANQENLFIHGIASAINGLLAKGFVVRALFY